MAGCSRRSRQCGSAVLLLAGERLGAGIYLGGNLIRGASGAAGELGLLQLVEGVGITSGVGDHSVVIGAVSLALDRIESRLFESLTARESTV